MAIMYGVMLLTVFVDLIVAVGLGVFISNILIIERLSRVQAKQVKAISDADENDANGKVLFFYLSGPMIFSVSKAISRQHSSIADYEAMILDLTDVPMIDVTVGLALENAIKDAQEAQCDVYLLCPNERVREQLEKFHVLDLVPDENTFKFRYEALNAAVNKVEQDEHQGAFV